MKKVNLQLIPLLTLICCLPLTEGCFLWCINSAASCSEPETFGTAAGTYTLSAGEPLIEQTLEGATVHCGETRGVYSVDLPGDEPDSIILYPAKRPGGKVSAQWAVKKDPVPETGDHWTYWRASSCDDVTAEEAEGVRSTGICDLENRDQLDSPATLEYDIVVTGCDQ